MIFKDCQRAALEHIRQYSAARREVAQETIAHLLEMSNIAQEDFPQALSSIQSHARVALHFHPDRLSQNLTSVADSLLADGLYKNQFETFLSNGALATDKGGYRDLWENGMFGEAYLTAHVTPSDRPKYGALNLMLLPDGPSPRFGSCYFLLKPHVLPRCTFSSTGSQLNPPEKGTLDTLDGVLAALLTESFYRQFALGVHNIRTRQLIDHLRDNLAKPFQDPSTQAAARNLDYFIEVQVHGHVRLADDVEILVADPSFKQTKTGKLLEKICEVYDIKLYWHCGFVLNVEEVPLDFRGPKMPSLARRVASGTFLDVEMIGEATADLKRNPERWLDRGPSEYVLQELKRLWHVLVKFGKPNNTQK